MFRTDAKFMLRIKDKKLKYFQDIIESYNKKNYSVVAEI